PEDLGDETRVQVVLVITVLRFRRFVCEGVGLPETGDPRLVGRELLDLALVVPLPAAIVAGVPANLARDLARLLALGLGTDRADAVPHVFVVADDADVPKRRLN